MRRRKKRRKKRRKRRRRRREQRRRRKKKTKQRRRTLPEIFVVNLHVASCCIQWDVWDINVLKAKEKEKEKKDHKKDEKKVHRGLPRHTTSTVNKRGRSGWLDSLEDDFQS